MEAQEHDLDHKGRKAKAKAKHAVKNAHIREDDPAAGEGAYAEVRRDRKSLEEIGVPV